MRLLLPIALACLSAIAVFGITRADPPRQAPASPLTPLMHQKLDKSQAILEGLTQEDFGMVTKNARPLKLLSLESGWNVIQTEEYAVQSEEFRGAADAILEAAAEKDIDRATAGYVDLTVRCIKCHSYMRKHRAMPTQ